MPRHVAKIGEVIVTGFVDGKLLNWVKIVSIELEINFVPYKSIDFICFT